MFPVLDFQADMSFSHSELSDDGFMDVQWGLILKSHLFLFTEVGFNLHISTITER